MEEEVDLNAEEIKNTDSRKSVTTSNVYSADFTDYSSDKNNSSGKETYIIDWDDSDDSEASCQLRPDHSSVHLPDEVSNDLENNELKVAQRVEEQQKINNNTESTFQKSTFVAQETYTQTSKTIIELAESEGVIVRSVDFNTLQTQTSYVSVTENKRLEYNVLTSNLFRNTSDNDWYDISGKKAIWPVLYNKLEDKSSKSDPDFEDIHSGRSEIEEEQERNIVIHGQLSYDNRKQKGNFDMSLSSNSDFEDDSLMEVSGKNRNKDNICSMDSDHSFAQNSINSEIKELYNKVTNCFDVFCNNQNVETQVDSQWVRALTPLTEESTIKKESIIDMTPCLEMATKMKKENNNIMSCSKEHDLKELEIDSLQTKERFKLPPIQNNVSSLCFLLSNQGKKKINLFPRDISPRRPDSKFNNWAAGENMFLNGTKTRLPNEAVHLPAIRFESGIHNIYMNSGSYYSSSSRVNIMSKSESPSESITIKDKIGELKMSDKRTRLSRSISPTLPSLPECSKQYDISQKGCELLCVELLRKLKSSSWCEVVDTLEEMPKVMESFWNFITELRVADFIRQVTVHVDSPRSQVARTACITLACILKHTNYTKKPDFYEAVTALLVKTGSFSRPVRRAANMALDEIVCGVDFTQAVTAICVHGVGHKSPLVRCAAARLLVVSCAVSGGGRGLLRGRPASAAVARRAALRALADLLQDKATDARKYAERLYAMLRPLSNFEAYFLTDVDVELASRQMKKYDQLLVVGTQDR